MRVLQLRLIQYWPQCVSAGQSASKTMLEHELQLNCDKYNPGDASGNGIPTGVFEAVADTFRDFTKLTILGPKIHAQATKTPLWPHGEQFVVTAMEGKTGSEFNAAARAWDLR